GTRSVVFLLVGGGNRRRRLRRWPHHARELSPLQELASLASPAGHFVFGRTDRLFRAATRFDGQEVSIAARSNEAEHAVVSRCELDQDDAPTGTGEVVHFVCFAQQAARFGGRNDDDLAARNAGYGGDFRVLTGARVAAPGTSTRLDERFEAEPERV